MHRSTDDEGAAAASEQQQQASKLRAAEELALTYGRGEGMSECAKRDKADRRGRRKAPLFINLRARGRRA
jgi:hypothetical protein